MPRSHHNLQERRRQPRKNQKSPKKRENTEGNSNAPNGVKTKKNIEKQAFVENNELNELKQLASKIAVNNTIVLTVGNLGYTNLLVNWWLSINKNTDLSKHSLILTYDKVLVSSLQKKLPYCHVGHVPYTTLIDPQTRSKPSEKATSFKKSGWDSITRFKLKAIHCLIEWGYTVYYVDPDVYVIRNSLNRLNSLVKENEETKMLIQEGKPFCCGVIYAPPNDVTKKLFSPKEWETCNTDDETYINGFFTKKYQSLRRSVHVLSLDRFPNGLKWKLSYTPDIVWKQISKGEIDLLHFNYISGIDNKIARMKHYNMWSRQMNIINVPKMFQPDLNDICLQKNKSVYPPHQSGPQIEQYTHQFMEKYTFDKTISSDYDYLPVYWTSVVLSETPNIRSKLKDWLRDLIKKSPNRKCWTVVQHCKGIQRTFGFMLPKDWIIFSTSDPNGVKNNEQSKTEVEIQTVNFIPIHRRKMMYWHTSGFGRMPERPQQRHRTLPQSQRVLSPQKAIKQITGEPTLLKRSDSKQFYTKNHITIPLLSSVHKEAKKASWNDKRKVLASFIGDVNIHQIRKQMREVLSQKSRIIIEGGKYKHTQDVKRFDELMSNSTFALCPRGYGNTSYRLVEAMQFGSIPVYISDVFSLPYNDVIDWNSISIIVKPEDLPKLYNKLKTIEEDQSKVDEYRNNIKTMHSKYFTMEGCCNNIVRYITK
jgi:hypothetical protein